MNNELIERIDHCLTHIPLGLTVIHTLGACKDALTQQQVPPIWVLTREINEYCQDGAYFEHAWTHKPTAQEVASVCGYDPDSDVVKHILSGGGRQGIENRWYHLERFDQNASK